MKKILKIILLIIILSIVIFSGYKYLIKGDSVSKSKISWLLEKPIAHRGLFDDENPENTIGAFEKAIEKGYSIELDIQLTKDKEVIVFHDDDLLRLTERDIKIEDSNYNDIKNIKILDTNYTIPTLKQVIEYVDGKVPLLIEIKDGKDIIELSKRSNEVMKEYEGDYAVQSFNPFVLEWYKDNEPGVLRGQLSGSYKKGAEKLKEYEKFVLRNLLLNFKSKPNFIAYEVQGIPNNSVEYVRKTGIPVLTWTVVDNKTLEKANLYTDNIIFNNFDEFNHEYE